MSKKDLAILRGAVIDSYRQAYTKAKDPKIATGFTPMEHVHFDGSFGQGQLLLGEIVTDDCRGCPPDDDSLSSSNSQIHSNFVHSMCKSLKHSGSANFENVHGCKLVFLDTSGRNGFNADAETAKHRAQITVKGMNHKASAKDLEIISKEAVESYNEIFKSARYSLDVFTTNMAAPIAKGSNHKAGHQLFMTEFVQSVGDDCSGCPPDDDAVSAKQLKAMHDQFENTLCGKLQRSGKGNLANVRDCSFQFVIDPTLGDDCRGCPPDDDAVAQ